MKTEQNLSANQDQLLELCQAAAASIFTYTSNDSERYYEDAYCALRDRPEQDDYPEGLYPWWPFKRELPAELLSTIDEEAECLHLLIVKMLEGLEGQLTGKGVDLKGLHLKDLVKRSDLIY